MFLQQYFDRSLDRWALGIWLAGVGLFFGAYLVGCFWAATGPGGDTDRSWAPLTFPYYSSVVSAPLVLFALLLAVFALVNRGPSKVGIIALVLSLATAVPATIILGNVLSILTEHATPGY